MTTPRQPGGYIYRQDINRARRATATARRYIERLLDERPAPALAATFLARIGLALGEIDESITSLEQIAQAH